MTFWAKRVRPQVYFVNPPIWRRMLNRRHTVFLFIGLFAVLISWFTPPRFDRIATLQSTVNCERNLHKKRCLEAERLDWAPPVRIFHPNLQTQIFLSFTAPTAPLVQPRLRGLHYDRPPPLSDIQHSR